MKLWKKVEMSGLWRTDGKWNIVQCSELNQKPQKSQDWIYSIWYRVWNQPFLVTLHKNLLSHKQQITKISKKCFVNSERWYLLFLWTSCEIVIAGLQWMCMWVPSTLPHPLILNRQFTCERGWGQFGLCGIGIGRFITHFVKNHSSLLQLNMGNLHIFLWWK